MSNLNRKNKTILLLVALLLVTAIVILVFSKHNDEQNSVEPAPTNEQISNDIQTEPPAQEEPKAETPSQEYDIDTLSSITQIVNKNRALPADYVPSDLVVPDVRLRLAPSQEQMKIRNVVTDNLEAMFAAAQQDNVTIVFGSGYRSYALQKQFYDGYVARDGQAAADRYSARPGTSEHQTGLSFDATVPDGTCHLEICFEDTLQGQWLAANAHKYGFIIRYLDGKESITGYQYEPWHFRYVGLELAAELHQTEQTMEEYFNLTD